MIALCTLAAWCALSLAACALVAWLARMRRRVLERRAWQERMAVAPWWS